MSFILILLTVAIFVILELVKAAKGEQQRIRRRLGTELPERVMTIERYFHPGHAWALIGDAPTVTVGVDDFSQRMIGALDRIDLPPRGAEIVQGDPFVTLRRGARFLTQVSPLGGVVVDVNEALLRKPHMVNRSPYERGWIMKVKPTNLQTDLRNLLRGVVAERWQEAVRMELIRWFTPRCVTVLQDGGTVIEHVGDLVSDAEWQRLVREFFPAVLKTQSSMNRMK